MTRPYFGDPHPYLVAAILVSGSQRKVALAMGVHASKVQVWTRRPDVPEEFMSKLAEVSAVLIRERMENIAGRFFTNPACLLSREFRHDCDDLETAHRLRFGHGAWEDPK